MSSDIPLPMPFSVMSSPSHMISPVPAVIVTIIRARLTAEESGITATEQPVNRLPEEAVATMVADCSTPKPMVRYRVYSVSLAVPAWPSL